MRKKMPVTNRKSDKLTLPETNKVPSNITKRFISNKAIFTFLDQASLSLVNFLIGLAFIYTASPEEYGFYTFFMSFFYLFSSVQNAIINTPMMVLAPRMKVDDADSFKQGIFGLLLPEFIIVFFVLIAVGITVDNRYMIAIIAAAGICFLLLREYFRYEEFTRIRPKIAFKRDIISSFIIIIGIGILAFSSSVNTSAVFLIVGASILLVFLRLIFKRSRSLFTSWYKVRESFKKSWTISRWSLVGATSSWVQSNTYVYIPFFLLGTKEVAFLAAAKLIMQPITLLVKSLQNLFKPLISSFLSKERFNDAKKLFFYGLAISFISLILYTGAVILLLDLLPKDWIPSDYKGITGLILLWALISFLRILIKNCSTFLQASLDFRSLAIVGIIIAICTVMVSFVAIKFFNTLGALVGLVFGEVLFVIILGVLLKKTMSKMIHAENKRS